MNILRQYNYAFPPIEGWDFARVITAVLYALSVKTLRVFMSEHGWHSHYVKCSVVGTLYSPKQCTQVFSSVGIKTSSKTSLQP